METEILPLLKDVAGGAAGTIAVIAFAWRRLIEIDRDLKNQTRIMTIILTKLGVDDDAKS